MGLFTALGAGAGFLLGGPSGAKVGAAIGGGLDGAKSNRDNKNAAAKERKNALDDNADQWVRHRKASEKGGFNPLTTMGMNSGQTGNPSGQSYVSAASTNAMLNGFVSAADSYAFDNDPMRDLERESAELRNDLTRLQLEELADIPAVARTAGAPTAGSTNVNENGGTSDLYRSVAMLYDDNGGFLRRDLPVGNATLDIDESVAPAEVVEDEFGDFVSWGFGLGKLGYEAGRAVARGFTKISENSDANAEWMREQSLRLQRAQAVQKYENRFFDPNSNWRRATQEEILGRPFNPMRITID